MQQYQAKILTNLDEVLSTHWQELWKKSENASVFNSYEWFQTCLETGNITDYELYVCYRDGELVAILPLHIDRHFGIKILGVLGDKFLVDTAFLVKEYDRELFKYFFGNILAKRNLFIHKVDSKATNLLHDIFPDMFFSLMSVNPCVNLEKDPLLTISKSTLSQIRSTIKKNPDQLRFKMYNGVENLQNHLHTMFVLEQNSAKKLRSMDIFSQQETKDFFQTISKNCSQLVRIGFLYYNTIPIAYQFGFLYRKVFVAYQTAYLHEYGKLRPGKTILLYLLQSLKENGVDTLDLGGGISTYKLEFTSDYRLLYDLYYTKNKLVMVWWKSINLLRRMKQIIFPEKNTRDHEFLFKKLQ